MGTPGSIFFLGVDFFQCIVVFFQCIVGVRARAIEMANKLKKVQSQRSKTQLISSIIIYTVWLACLSKIVDHFCISVAGNTTNFRSNMCMILAKKVHTRK